MKSIKKLSKSALILSLASIIGSQGTSFAADTDDYKTSIGELTPSYDEEVSEDKAREFIDEITKRTEEIKRELDQDLNDVGSNDETPSIDQTGDPIEKDIVREAEEKPVRKNLNEGVDLENPPRIINEGKADYSEDIKSLEESILDAAISSNAAKFLLENSPNTVKKIKDKLENQIKNSEELLSEAKKALADLKEEENADDDDLKALKDSYFDNKVILESANMLLTSTPETVKNISQVLDKQVRDGKELTEDALDLINQLEEEKTYIIKPLDRKTIGLRFDTPSEENILNYWRNYKTRATQTEKFDGIDLFDSKNQSIYSLEPNIANDQVGQINEIVLEDINHVTNTLRYSLGLDEVAVSKEKSHYALAASIVNHENKVLNHHPPVPASLREDSKIYQDGKKGSGSSNLHYGLAPYRQINSFIMDNDPSNWDDVGHRLWLISPGATLFGYGAYDRYGAAYVFDDHKKTDGNELVAFPSNVGLTEFFDNTTPFSLAFGRNYSIVGDIKITMTNLNTGKVSVYETGKNIYVNNSLGYGKLKSLTWGIGFEGKAGDQVNIKVEGVSINKTAYPIEYTVNFISLENSHN